MGKADTVEILRSWNGLGRPSSQLHELRWDGANVSGDASVPASTFRSFLDLLALSPLVRGEYQPRIDHLDDYPAISIAVKAGEQAVVFFTRSNGPGHAPWGFHVGCETYVIPSDTPNRALALLAPHLPRVQSVAVRSLRQAASRVVSTCVTPAPPTAPPTPPTTVSVR